jgi:hypothetical protein
MIFYFYASQAYEGVHPLQGGILRRKPRSQRRPGFQRENSVRFFVRRLREMAMTYLPGLWFLWRLERLRRKIEKDPASRCYTDIALTPMGVAEFGDDLELYHVTDSARRALDQARSRATAPRDIQARGATGDVG